MYETEKEKVESDVDKEINSDYFAKEDDDAI